jgi:hypothetical protein
MLIYKVKPLTADLSAERLKYIQRDNQLIQTLTKIKTTMIYIKLFSQDDYVSDRLKTFYATELCGIDKLTFDRIIEKNKVSDDEEKRMQNRKYSFIDLHLTYFCDFLKECVEQLLFPLSKNQKDPITNYVKLLDFVAKNPLHYFLDMEVICRELTRAYESEESEVCSRYQVSISDQKDDTYYFENIYMIVRVNKESKSQIHIDIHKNIQNTLYQFFNGLKTPSLSILLHSFASEYFGSEVWFTCPLASMANILKKEGILYKTEPNYDDNENFQQPLEKLYPWVYNNRVCSDSVLVCPGGLHYFIKTADMLGIWKKSVQVTLIDQYTFVTNQIDKPANQSVTEDQAVRIILPTTEQESMKNIYIENKQKYKKLGSKH